MNCQILTEQSLNSFNLSFRALSLLSTSPICFEILLLLVFFIFTGNIVAELGFSNEYGPFIQEQF